MKKTLLILALLLVAAAAAFLTFGGGSDSGVHNSGTSSNFTVSDEEIAQITQAPSLTQTFSSISTRYDAKAAYDRGDYQTARELWLTLANRDDDATSAQYNLGKLYANGQGVQQSDDTARDWWQKSMRDIGQSRVLLSILPDPSDPQYTYATIHEKWQPAAAGDVDAQYKLAILYLTGIGVPQNDTKALIWFEKAANQNHAAAQYQLGKIHDRANRVPCAAAQAIQWWEKASALGNADAQNILALRYDMGFHLTPHYPRDECRAIALREQAAAQGHPEAQTWLAQTYMYDQPHCNLVANRDKARALLEQAIANGGENTRKQAERVLYALEHNGRYPSP